MGEIKMGCVHGMGNQPEPETTTEDTAGCDSLPLGEGHHNGDKGHRADYGE